MILGLLETIEAKALAHRLAFKAVVAEVSAQGGPNMVLQIQKALEAAQQDLQIKDDGLRKAVADEINSLVEMLNDLASAPRSAVDAEPRIQMS